MFLPFKVTVLAMLCWSGVVVSFPLDMNIHRKRDVNAALVPSFGWQSGVNPDGTGNCDGAVNGTDGKPILVPCQCPPNSTFFLAALNKNVAAGFVTTNPTVKLTFPTDNSTASQLARLNAAAVTLQNLEGPGVGCPLSSTKFAAQNKAIQAAGSNMSSTPTPPVVPSSVVPAQCPNKTQPLSSVPNNTSGTPQSGDVTDELIVALAPVLGWQSGISPDGTGNCDGAVNGTNGKPIRVPCQCPPDHANYVSNLTANIRAGHVVLNPSVLVTFPTDNSTSSQSARLNAAVVTIQNLNGAGKGCPVSATNFTAQSKAISAKL